MPKRILTGTVVSDKGHKTIVVKVDRTTKHPVYGKIMRSSAKFHAHDANNEAKIGDTVDIVECPPVSKLKHFALLKRVKVFGEIVTDSASDVTA